MVDDVELNPDGVRELLHDPGLIAHLEGLAGSVATAHGGDTHIETEVYVSGRAIVRVIDDDPKSLFKEAYTHRLSRALDAAGASRNAPGTKWGPKKR